MKLKILLFLLSIFIASAINAQEDNLSWFHVRLVESSVIPSFEKENTYLKYTGNDVVLNKIFQENEIITFRKAHPTSKNDTLKRTYLLISKNDKLLRELLKNASHVFEYGEALPEEETQVFYPNDYGTTNVLGTNVVDSLFLDYLDFLEVPKAWYYTTGSRDVVIGISDGTVDTTNIDFKGKVKVLRKSTLSKGHGYGVAANAAAQGNNGYGIPGICYDCSIYATSFGFFGSLKTLTELSDAGVRIINCSWGGSKYYETAQEAVYKMYEKGAIIVAAGHNRSWADTKGKVFSYPASYDKVISVASVMHRYDTISDNILLDKNGDYYAANIKHFLGRTIGFKDNDTTKVHHIYDISTSNLNPGVDILVPSVGLFRFSKFILENKRVYTEYESTSGGTPFVSGTIGLMLTLNPCLTFDEIDSILKITSINIDYIEDNKRYAGNYGAGVLNTGSAVKLVHDLMNENETAYIENQLFSRWDFEINAISKEVIIKNQEFTKESTFKLNSKKSVLLEGNVLFEPNEDGSILIEINQEVDVDCDLDNE